MNRFFQTIADGALHNLRVPIALRRALAGFPDAPSVQLAPPRSIDGGCVVRWDDLGGSLNDSGRLLGWRARPGRYDGITLERHEYSLLQQVREEQEWSCDIAEIDGFSASKSVLADFTTTDALVETNSPHLIDRIDSAKLAQNLAHPEIRILNRPRTSDHFYRFAWDGRLFLANGGGSHHLAAAKYIAARMGRQVPLRGRLRTFALNPEPVHALCADFEMVVLPDSAKLWCATFDALRDLRATWYQHGLPRNAGRGTVLLLPKSEPRAVAAAQEFRRAGLTSFNAFLHGLLRAQTQHLGAWDRRAKTPGPSAVPRLASDVVAEHEAAS